MNSWKQTLCWYVSEPTNECRDSHELHVYVRGDRARMLEIARTQPIFNDKKPTNLQRRKQTLDEFEQSMIQAQHKKMP